MDDHIKWVWNLKWLSGAWALSIILGYVAYQAYFSPLAKYPGPLSAKFSNWRATYYAWKGDGHLDLWICHQKYGPIVRYAPNFISFNTERGLKEIYSTSPNIWKSRRIAALNHRSANLFTMYNKAEHAKRRRLIGPLLNDAGVKKFEPRLLRHIGSFCILLCPSGQNIAFKPWGPAMNVSDWCNYLTFDVISDILFGIDYNLLGSEDHRHVIHQVEDASVRNIVIPYMPLLRLGRLDKVLFRKSVEGTRGFWKFVLHALEARSAPMAKPEESVVSHLTFAVDKISVTKLNDVAIQSEVGTMLIAGFDTTASALCGLMFYLSRNPNSYHKLIEEIRSSFSSWSEIRLGPQLRNCNYLQACITETMRMSPPEGTCPWREVGSGGETVDGHFMPEGTTLGTGIYSIHHDEAYFPRPHEFIPERWLDDSSDEPKKCINVEGGVYNPFSIGPRGCIGKTLALAEISLTIASVLWLYDIRAAEGPDGNLGAGNPLADRGRTNPYEYQLIDRVVSTKEGPMIQFRQRDTAK